MIDFKPGDEVVCVDDSLAWGREPCGLVKGQVYRVLDLGEGFWGDIGVNVGVPSPHPTGRWSVSRFRKVQRRDLSVWLATKNTIEDPKRVPATEDA